MIASPPNRTNLIEQRSVCVASASCGVRQTVQASDHIPSRDVWSGKRPSNDNLTMRTARTRSERPTNSLLCSRFRRTGQSYTIHARDRRDENQHQQKNACGLDYCRVDTISQSQNNRMHARVSEGLERRGVLFSRTRLTYFNIFYKHVYHNVTTTPTCL